VSKARGAVVKAIRGGKVVARGSITKSGKLSLRNAAKLRKGTYTLTITSTSANGKKSVAKQKLKV
jgi:hypothetical protein